MPKPSFVLAEIQKDAADSFQENFLKFFHLRPNHEGRSRLHCCASLRPYRRRRLNSGDSHVLHQLNFSQSNLRLYHQSGGRPEHERRESLVSGASPEPD